MAGKKKTKLPKALSMVERSEKEDALLRKLGGSAFETEIDGVEYEATADGLKPLSKQSDKLTGPAAQKIIKRKRKPGVKPEK